MLRNIVLCGPEDSEALTDIWRESIIELAPSAFSEEQISAWVARVRSPSTYAQEAKHRTIWAWKEGHHLIAFIELEPDGHIDRLYALKEASGRGIATKLIEHVIDYAKETGLTQLYTEASDLARPAFERCGFKMIRKNPVNLEGILMHNWIMECSLGRR